METYNIKQLKKTSSGLGFYCFAVIILFLIIPNIIALICEIFGVDYESDTSSFFISGFTSITAFFVTGLIYCFISNTPLQSVIHINRVKITRTLPFIAIGFSVSLLSNYISDIILIKRLVF